ncbi:MAG: SLBB domain-containing protein [Deltaproteobacteria bacterium]|nr:SLBB domain-containing protein [Deltaproteobacteria bacterium]
MNEFGVKKARANFDRLKAEAAKATDALRGGARVLVGTATCGRSAGAMAVLDAFRREIEDSGVEARVLQAGCIGHCYAEPLAIVSRPGEPSLVYHHLTVVTARTVAKKLFLEDDPCLEFLLGAVDQSEIFPTLADLPRFGREQRRLLRRCGLHDPGDIMQAIALGAYAGFVRAIEIGPGKVISAVRESGLRGLGGAGFPVWRKWDACARQSDHERYIVCNGDEGDPGAFMDRTILESDPHAIIEGMLTGALAIGARRGFAYVRAEYPLAVRTLSKAADDARKAGLLGNNVLGSGFSFELTIAQGAGAFVCGESSALMYSVEGKRGMPRVRPPQSAERGLFGKPTVLNNVKSLASIGPILEEGPERFASVGTAGSKGTAVFALAGKIVNAGLVEVPMGTTLRELIFDIGGGIPKGKRFRAAQIGGPSGGCIPESLLDTPVDFDALRAAGAMMGSGGLVVLDEDNCVVETARFFLEFTQAESCGKCTFCRIGTRHMLDILTRITTGNGRLEDLSLLDELGREITDGSLCGLGKTAPNPVVTTLRFFRDDYEAHIQEKRCPARTCRDLMSYYILPERCARGCDACVGSCPTEAIYTDEKRRIKVIDQALCVKCESCVLACPHQYDAVRRISPVRDVPPSAPKPQKKA